MSNKIGEKIRQARVLSGLSQENVAEEIGMSHGNFGKIERGDIDVSSTHLLAIAKVLKVNASDFFESAKLTAKESKAEYGYATKSELMEINSALKKLTLVVENMQEQLSKSKSQAKKKAVKK